MTKKNDLYVKLKELTGCSYTEIAEKFGVSKQHIHKSFSNTSMVYENSNKFMALYMANLKIDEHKAEIEKLEKFKKEIMRQEIKINKN